VKSRNGRGRRASHGELQSRVGPLVARMRPRCSETGGGNEKGIGGYGIAPAAVSGSGKDVLKRIAAKNQRKQEKK
jgi:hypothetical protein